MLRGFWHRSSEGLYMIIDICIHTCMYIYVCVCVCVCVCICILWENILVMRGWTFTVFIHRCAVGQVFNHIDTDTVLCVWVGRARKKRDAILPFIVRWVGKFSYRVQTSPNGKIASLCFLPANLNAQHLSIDNVFPIILHVFSHIDWHKCFIILSRAMASLW
jgi:hypothetical protein